MTKQDKIENLKLIFGETHSFVLQAKQFINANDTIFDSLYLQMLVGELKNQQSELEKLKLQIESCKETIYTINKLLSKST